MKGAVSGREHTGKTGERADYRGTVSAMAPPSASASAGAGAAAVAPLMSSDEVNLLVYAYLAESTLEHSAFTLYNESKLDSFVSSPTFGDGSHQRSATSNGEPASATATSSELHPAIPPTGHLIRILQKGLLYLQAEAKYRGVNACCCSIGLAFGHAR